MKLRYLAGLAFSLAPAAHAQSGCALVEKILGEATGGYPTMMGDEIDDGWYESSVYLAGADECTIALGQNSSIYECAWPETGVAAADTRLAGLESVGRACLDDWDKVSIAGEPSFSGLKINRGFSYEEPNADRAIEIYHETYDDGTETVVWFRVYGPPPPKPAKPVPSAAAPAPAAVAGPADITSPTSSSVDRAPPLAGMDLRYVKGTFATDFIVFLDQAHVQRIDGRAYVWTISTLNKPLAGAWTYMNLREVACGSTPYVRHAHSIHLGNDYLPNGKSIPMEDQKFQPATTVELKAIADFVCRGVTLPGASYPTPGEAAANRLKESAEHSRS